MKHTCSNLKLRSKHSGVNQTTGFSFDQNSSFLKKWNSGQKKQSSLISIWPIFLLSCSSCTPLYLLHNWGGVLCAINHGCRANVCVKLMCPSCYKPVTKQLFSVELSTVSKTKDQEYSGCFFFLTHSGMCIINLSLRLIHATQSSPPEGKTLGR